MTSVGTINAQHPKIAGATIQTTERRLSLLKELGKMA
jgi:hypothetical protein